MIEAEAHAMTAQPPDIAAPTPGPYKVVRMKRRQGWEIRGPKNEVIAEGPLWKPEHHKELWANADLLAASWATAAERDRLVVVNEGLVKALESVTGQFGPDAHRYGCECGGRIPPGDACSETRNKILTALADARTPPVGQSPEGVGG